MDRHNKIMNDYDFVRLKEIASYYAGIKLYDTKREQISHQLRKRMGDLNFLQFYDYIEFINRNLDERNYFINLITNLRTDFFRDAYQFETLEKELINIIKNKGRIRIWSAGCSTGEEAYSIAITVFEALKGYIDPNVYDIKILATDVNTKALEIAKQGIYENEKIEKLGTRKKWFHSFTHNEISYVKVDNQLNSMISFRYLNLLGHWPMKGLFDVIFFRNVSLYLTDEATHDILEKFDNYLKINGLIFIGFSENIGGLSGKYISLQNKVFRKIK